MKVFTFNSLCGALLLGTMLITTNAGAQSGVRSKIQPASGTQYLGSDSAAQSNPQKLFTYDDHGNAIQTITGSMTSMDIEEKNYSYKKPYPVLLNDFYYTQDKTGAHDTVYLVRTTVNEDSIRVGYEISSSYGDPVNNFTFDDEGHITGYVASSDSIVIGWNGDNLSSYYRKAGSASWIQHTYDLQNISTAFALKPFDASGYEYENLLDGFTDNGGILINCSGNYGYKASWYGIDIEGALSVTTTANADSTEFVQLALVNDTDTVSLQTVTLLDNYGSYTCTKTQPAISPGMTLTTTATCNEFGDVIRTESTQDYGDGYLYTTSSYDPVDYDGDKPLRQMHYYEQDGQWILGYVIVYDEWHEPAADAISFVNKEIKTLGGELYTIDGRKVRTLTANEATTGRINAASGLYIVKLNTTNGVKSSKIVVR